MVHCSTIAWKRSGTPQIKPHSVDRIKFLTQNHVTVISFNFQTNVWKKTVLGKSWFKWNVCVTSKSYHGILCELENNARNQVNFKRKYVFRHYPVLVEQKSGQKNRFVWNIFIFVSFSFHWRNLIQLKWCIS